MKDKINRYINYMKDKYGISAAMVTGSYVTKEMGPQSDIDIFFIGNNEFQALRGREYFENQEFEYFISPEWKYYDRLKSDKISMRIYSSAQILYDPHNQLSKIQVTAKSRIKSLQNKMSDEQKKDYQFWIETIQTDGEGLLDKKEYANFNFFSGKALPKMCNLLCELNNTLPIYEKYAIREIKEVDLEFGEMLLKFLLLDVREEEKKEYWMKICQYLQKKLGDYNIKEYLRVQAL